MIRKINFASLIFAAILWCSFTVRAATTEPTTAPATKSTTTTTAAAAATNAAWNWDTEIAERIKQLSAASAEDQTAAEDWLFNTHPEAMPYIERAAKAIDPASET